MVARFEIDCVRLLIYDIHEWDFKSSTTYPFDCIIFLFCTNAIWHINVIRTPTGTVDISLIRDVANVVELRRGPRVDLQSLSENFAAMVKQAQAADPNTLETTDTTPTGSVPGTSRAPSSSQYT